MSTKRDKRRNNLRDFIREQKTKKRKEDGNNTEENSIEFTVIAPKNPQKTISSAEIRRLTSHDDYVVIDCNDQQFVVPEVVIQSARLLKHTLESGFKESSERKITLSVDPIVMEEILRFLFIDYLENGASMQREKNNDSQLDLSQISVNELLQEDDGSRNQRISFLFELKPALVMDILLTSHYLIIPNLLKSATRMLADHILDVPTFEGLPRDTIHAILGLLTPLNLCQIENSSILEGTGITSSVLNNLWKKHATKEKHYHLILERQDRTGVLQGKSGDENINWKRQFIESDFEEQCRKLIIKEFQHKENEFLEMARIYGPHIRRLSLDPCGLIQRDLFRETINILSPYLEELELSYQIDAKSFSVVSNELAKANMTHLYSLVISDAEIKQLDSESPLLNLMELPNLRKLHITETHLDESCSKSLVSVIENREKFHITDFSLHSSQLSSEEDSISFLVMKTLYNLANREDLRLQKLDLGDIGFRIPRQVDSNFFECMKTVRVESLFLDTNQLAWNPFYGGEVTANIVKSLFENPNVKVLSLGRCKIGGDTFNETLPILANNDTMEELIIPGNTLYESSIQVLGNMLQQNRSLKCLHIANDSIRSEDLSLLLPGISFDGSQLERLYLHRNKITTKAALAFIANVFHRNTNLRELSISVTVDSSVQEFLDDLRSKFPDRDLKLHLNC